MPGLVAILCSGQGNQCQGMFDLLVDNDAARPILATASAELCEDVISLTQKGNGALFANRAAQILCCARTLAAWAALGEARPQRVVLAGYSVGELAAWGCAGLLDAKATLRLTATRAALMDAAAPAASGMAGVVGLRREALVSVMTRHQVQIAIVNDIDSFVVAGITEALDALCRDAIAAGATRARRLNVAVPSHTTFLSSAVAPFAAALRDAAPRAPISGRRLLSGIDASSVLTVESGVDKLAQQIATPIDWAACLDSCLAAGATRALELGPGNALSRMAERVFGVGGARAIDDFRTLEGVRAWLQHEN